MEVGLALFQVREFFSEKLVIDRITYQKIITEPAATDGGLELFLFPQVFLRKTCLRQDVAKLSYANKRKSIIIILFREGVADSVKEREWRVNILA